jgi:hypothetical protein
MDFQPAKASRGQSGLEGAMGQFLLLIAGFAIMIVIGNAIKKETGVAPPSRSAMRGMRRRARKAGMGQEDYFDRWVERKRKG